MSDAKGALHEAGRPFPASSLWAPLLLVLVACGAIVYYGLQVAKTLELTAANAARVQGALTAHEINGFIDREHERLGAFVAEKEDEIRSILGFPENWPAIDALQTSVKRMFRGALAFSVTGPDGKPLFEDFDGLVGAVCQAAMHDYVRDLQDEPTRIAIPPIHPVPDAYHFDLISPWRLDSGEWGLFFVSMSPQRIAELIAAAEAASGARIVLVNRSEPDLIEVSAIGARDELKGDFRIVPEDLVKGHFAIDLDKTNWRLLVLPDREALDAEVGAVFRNIGLSVFGLLLISAALLLAIRRFEQRNSSLFMRSLQSSVSRQRAILQSMVDGMVTIDASGKILHVNDAVTDLFGYQAKELIGANVRVLMPDPDRSAHDGYLNSYLTTGASKILGKGREVMARRKDGSLFPILLTLGESQEGDEHIFVGILHDISARADAQRKIEDQAMTIKRSTQELEEIGQVASIELQAPLQRIAMLGKNLDEGGLSSLSGDAKAQLRDLSDEARGMSELVKGLVDYTRRENEPKAALVDLDAILLEVQDDLAAQISNAGAEVSVDALGRVKGDAKQLRQVFWNLLDNALKFRDPERMPKIHIGLEKDDGESADGQASTLSVSVTDNGIGIPEDQLDAVFDAFHRLQPREAYPGNGLGLSICRKIVEGLGGSISARSVPGVGSAFIVRLRRAQESAD